MVTGRYPTSGSNIAANLVAYVRTTTGFTVRALNQSGTPITTAVDVFYHAAAHGYDQLEEVRTATVTTNSSGYATVNYANPVAGVVPVGVAASGGSPDSGPNIPVSLVVSGRTATGFTVRAINQAGAAIASASISLSYVASWTSYLDAGAGGVGANGRHGHLQPDAAAIPTSIVASGVAPSSGGSIAASLIAHNPSSIGFRVRVLNQTGAAVTGQAVTLSYHAVVGARS